MNNTIKPSPAARHKARCLLIQALYQWQINPLPIIDIATEFLSYHADAKIDLNYFNDVLQGIVEHFEALDQLLHPYLDRPINEVSPIEKNILRLGAYELAYRPDLPYRIVINEALRLTKTYGGSDGHKFVNGILDKLADQLRSLEKQTEQ